MDRVDPRGLHHDEDFLNAFDLSDNLHRDATYIGSTEVSNPEFHPRIYIRE